MGKEPKKKINLQKPESKTISSNVDKFISGAKTLQETVSAESPTEEQPKEKRPAKPIKEENLTAKIIVYLTPTEELSLLKKLFNINPKLKSSTYVRNLLKKDLGI